MTALDIYNQDITDRERGECLPRQDYFASLRDALDRELMTQGYSEFLDQLLIQVRQGEMERIYALDFAALMECYNMIALGRDMQDASEFVPHLQHRSARVVWAAAERQQRMYLPITPDLEEKIKVLRAVSRQLVAARNSTVIPQADDAARQEIDQVLALNRMLNDRCNALKTERDELRERVRHLEEGVITEQVGYAIEARRIEEEESLRRHYEQQQEAAKSAFREQFAKAQAEEAQRLEDEARQVSALRAEAAQDYAAVRQGMAADLKQLTALLEAKINAWDRSLDRAECRLLARCYASLHSLWATELPGIILNAQGSDPAVLSGLAHLQEQLRDRLSQLETAMMRLGLTILRPAAGEAFNGAYHLPVGMSAGAAGDAAIARCLVPGVMVMGAQEALLKAEVELK